MDDCAANGARGDCAGVGELPGLILPYGRATGESAFQEWSETVATVFDIDPGRDGLDGFRFGFSAP